jgi:hypothetical protein
MDETKQIIVFDDFKKVEARNTGKTGFGLYAREDIDKGKLIFYARGILIYAPPDGTAEDAATLPNSIGIDQTHWLEGFETNPLQCINHSWKPNKGIRGKVSFVAMKDIRKDEEIVVDYSITECDPDWVLGDYQTLEPILCSCGSAHCRGLIRAIQFLPENISNSYLPYIPPRFQKEYLRINRKQV